MLNKIVRLGLVGLLVGGLVIMSVGCSMDPPADGVQVKVTNTLTEMQADNLEDKLKSYDSGISSTGRLTVNKQVTFNFSPVADAKAFADKIDCGKVESVEGNVITITAN